MDIPALAFAVLFGIWLAGTVAFQIPQSSRLNRWIEQHDHFGLVPQWTFFAPTPGTQDHFLLYRVFARGRWQRWSVVSMPKRRSLLKPVWNPGKRRGKALVDIANGLLEIAAETQKAPRALCLSTGYLALLNLVTIEARAHTDATSCQFAIAWIDARADTPKADLLMQSETHPL